MMGRSQGARLWPSSAEKKFCMIPALTPRRLGEDSIAMMARHTGRNGPSTAPMMAREMSNTGNEGARPERIEHAEKMMRKASRKGLRLPLESDQRAIR